MPLSSSLACSAAAEAAAITDQCQFERGYL